MAKKDDNCRCVVLQVDEFSHTALAVLVSNKEQAQKLIAKSIYPKQRYFVLEFSMYPKIANWLIEECKFTEQDVNDFVTQITEQSLSGKVLSVTADGINKLLAQDRAPFN